MKWDKIEYDKTGRDWISEDTIRWDGIGNDSIK